MNQDICIKCKENSHMKENSKTKVKSCVCNNKFHFNSKIKSCQKKGENLIGQQDQPPYIFSSQIELFQV